MHPRQGSIYVVVLMSSLIVATMALASIETMRWYSRDLFEEADSLSAQTAAESGLEAAIGKICSNSAWRASYTNNVDSSPITIANASILFRLIDDDGILNDNAQDKCDVLVTSQVGNTRYALRATLEADGDPMGCLSYALATAEKLEVATGSVLATDQAVASNEIIDVKTSAYLTGNCYSTGSCSGNIYGSINAFGANVPIPSASTLEYYKSVGTAINITSLPQSLGRYTLQKHLMSATTNTLTGVVNAQGIYVIDCNYNEIRIKNCRFQCTLVLVNPSSNSKLAESIFWEAPVANYPILLVEGDFEISLSRDPLTEAVAGRNLNPAGTPYRGVTDNNTTTVYPSLLRGLIYTSGKLDFPNGSSEVQGCIIANNRFTSTGDLLIHYRDIFKQSPPPGFTTASRMRLVPGTVRRVTPP